MSYILDALKRADAERGRGAVPGLHARQVTTSAPDVAPSARAGVWLGVAAVLVLGVAAAGWWVWQTPVQTPVPITTTAVVAVPAPVLQPVVTAAPAPAFATPAVATAASAPATKPVPIVAAPAASAVAARVPPRPKPAPVVKAAPPTVVAPATVPLLSELPEDIRRQIPALAITGAVYSNNPGQRLLLLNNQVLTQGSQAAPELKLEEIGEHSSVFSFRGTRFRLAH